MQAIIAGGQDSRSQAPALLFAHLLDSDGTAHPADADQQQRLVGQRNGEHGRGDCDRRTAIGRRPADGNRGRFKRQRGSRLESAINKSS